MEALTHNALAESLATHLRNTQDRAVWTDMQIGPSGSPRPDVYTIPYSYSRFVPLAYEVKVSKADFQKDVTAGKWTSYLEFASGVIFATPLSLGIGVADLPKGAGLISYGETGAWRMRKGPTIHPIANLSRDAWIKLVIDGIKRQRIESARKEFSPWEVTRKHNKTLGEEVCRALCDLASVRSQIDVLSTVKIEQEKSSLARYQAAIDVEQKRLDTLQTKIEQLVSQAAVALNLPSGTTMNDLFYRAMEERQRVNPLITETVQVLERSIARLQRLNAAPETADHG